MAWKKVYEHDKNGTDTFGSKEELLKNIDQGLAVRVVIVPEKDNDDAPSDLRAVACDPKVVFVRFGEAFAEVDWTASIWPHTNRMQFMDPPPIRYLVNICTSGEAQRLLVSRESGRVPENQHLAARWFIDV